PAAETPADSKRQCRGATVLQACPDKLRIAMNRLGNVRRLHWVSFLKVLLSGDTFGARVSPRTAYFGNAEHDDRRASGLALILPSGRPDRILPVVRPIPGVISA